ncbi:MAG TPA: prepilin-type N-terminal cleavage/methylation domain-containing protein [Gemmatimonadaceae bacterium]
MSRPVRRRPRSGFTLLESVAALAIVGLSSAAALAALSAELRVAVRLRHAAAAEALAQHRLATLRLAVSDASARLPDSLRRGAFGPPFAAYRWRAAREAVPGEPDLVRLHVEIEWPGGSYGLTTYDLGAAASPARPPVSGGPVGGRASGPERSVR